MNITLRWACLTAPYVTGCDAHGTGPRSDSQAAKHVETTGHSTTVWGEPRKDAK